MEVKKAFATCPKCKVPISSLYNQAPALVISYFSIREKDGRARRCYTEETYEDRQEDGDYYCPHCRVLLADSEASATRILLGKEIVSDGEGEEAARDS